MTYVWIGLRRSGKLLLKNIHMLNVKGHLALQALLFPLRRRLLVRGLLRGLPPLPLDVCPARGVEVPLDARPVWALLSPRLLRGLRIREWLARGGLLLLVPPLPRLALPTHHCTLCEVISRECLRSPAPVLDPPALPGLLAENHGRIVEPAPGWLDLVTGLVGRALGPLPVCGLVVESVVGGSRLDLLPPVNGLADFAPVRGPDVTGRGLLTATSLVGTALAVTGLGLRTATGLGVSVRVPMVTRGLVVTGPGHAVSIADPLVTGPFFPLTGKKSAIQA